MIESDRLRKDLIALCSVGTSHSKHSNLALETLDRLKEITQDLCDKWQCECIEVDGEPERGNDPPSHGESQAPAHSAHLHLLFRYAPQLQLSKFIGNLKSVSSRRIKQEFNLGVDNFWNESYSIDSVGGAPLDVLKQYVQNQTGC